MSLRFSSEIKEARLQAMCDALDADTSTLVIYNEKQETVCEMSLPNPCKQSISNGTLKLKNFAESMVLINATATNAKIMQNGSELVSMLVGNGSSNADLKLDSTALYAGTLLRLNGWTITEI